MGLLHLLATSLLAHLPVDLLHAAGGATAAHEANGGVADLVLTGDIQGLDLGGEVGHRPQGVVGLQDHDITSARHVALVQTLDVHAHIVTGASLVHTLVVHLHSEHLADAGVGGGVGGHEHHLITRLHLTLLHAASQHITHTLDLVGARDGQTHGSISLALGHHSHVVQSMQQGVHMDGLTSQVLHVLALPPGHLLGLLDQVVTHPAGDGDDGHALLDEGSLPAHLGQGVVHLIGNLLVALLLVACGIAVHLVHANDQLLHTQQVDEAGVLAGLALHLAGLVVALLDGGGEVTVGGHHEQAHISLGSAGNHVLDEIPVAWGIDDGVVVLLGEELLGGAGDGHTTGALLLLGVHVEGEGEGGLAQTGGLLLQLLQLTLGDASQLEDEAASGGALAGIDMAADDNRKMGLAFSHGDWI
mmetsp:Transcript_7898/g.21071  ORF Transcript_7898/g.21071 Transcript_7898/m.21071 type:complete len:416 (+) Transcript_7898:1508-2755(+)